MKGTMAEFRWIKTSLFLILVLQFTVAATEECVPSITVKDGDAVTLPCDTLIDDHKNCDSIWWGFDDLRKSGAVVLVKDGKIHDEAKNKSDRLSVSEKCSLVIKNVTAEDGGRYNCIRYKSGQKQDTVVYLSVVTITEHKDTDEVTVNCSVSTYEQCTLKVKWLLDGQDVDKDNKDLMTSKSSCSTSLKFNTSRFNSLMCEVTDGDKVQKFPLRNSPSGDKAGEDTTITITTKTTEGDTKSAVWLYVTVPGILFALLIIIIIVAVIKWKRTKGQTQTDGKAADPEEGVSYASVSYTKKTDGAAQSDPEEDVSYASVSYTKKTNGAAQGRSTRDDAVTYASVNASATNHSSLYATVTIT